MKVPFNRLRPASDGLRNAIGDAMERVMDSGWYVLGSEVESFEHEFAAWVGARHAVGCGSGTDAIELALRVLGVGEGDEVITQANTCVPTIAAIARAGATPVLCDVEPAAATMDPDSLAAAIGPRTRAVVPVHLYGQCADLEEVLERAKGLPVVEDCAQAHGARFHERTAGTMGRIGAFSFYPTKNLGALGDGGAVVTADAHLDKRLRLLRQYGQTDRYRHEAQGINSRLDELQAAILRTKLPGVDAANDRRRAIAAAYDEALAGTLAEPLERLPNRSHVFHLYVLRVPERETFQRRMAERGIGTLIHYPLPIHRQPAYAHLAEGPVPLGTSERLAERIVSLPIHPGLTAAEVEAVGSAACEAAM